MGCGAKNVENCWHKLTMCLAKSNYRCILKVLAIYV